MFRFTSFCLIAIATFVCKADFVAAQTVASRAPTVDTSGESYATSFSPLPDGGSITSTAFDTGAPVNFYVAEAQPMYGFAGQSNAYQPAMYQAYQPNQQGFAPQTYATYPQQSNSNMYQVNPYQNQQIQPFAPVRYAQAPNANQMQYPPQPQSNSQQQTQSQPARATGNGTSTNATSAAYRQPTGNIASNFEQVGYRQPTYQPIGQTQPAQWQTPIQSQFSQISTGPVWRTAANYQNPNCCGQQPSPFRWAPPANYTPQTQNFAPSAPQYAPVVGQPSVPTPPSYNPYVNPTPNRTQWKPLVPLRALPPGIYVGQGLIGQPVAYVDGEPVRNFIRYVSP